VVNCLKDPLGYFGMAQGENIEIVNIATNAEQANKVFFRKLTSRLQRPCFHQFHPRFVKSQIEFPNGLRLHSLHAANESWEGLNLLAWIMDEASAFRTSSGADNALKCYSTLRSSAHSRFHRYRWVGLIISFARRQQLDFTLTKYEQAKTNPRMYSDRASTWEVNPQFDPEHPLFEPFEWVPVEELNIMIPAAFADDFAFDPVDARTKYMCEPPPQEGGFFELPHKIEEAVNRDLPEIRFTKSVRELSLVQPGSDIEVLKRFTHLEVEQLPPRLNDVTYFMHGDPGLVSDFFALCLCHTLPESMTITDGEGKERELKKVGVGFVITWEPKARTPVDMLNVNEVMLAIARYYGVRLITLDKWNSANSIQMFLAAGIHAEDMSFSNSQQFAMYRNLKMLFYNDFIELPPGSDQLIKELQFLKVINNKIEHDVYGKDRADAVAAACWSATGAGLSPLALLVQETLGEIWNEPQAAQYAFVPFKF
jgi:hypothetical protein